jgi:uncharacterized membrane protein YciS (DUF1049 family)
MKIVRRLLVIAILFSMAGIGMFFAMANDAAVPLNLLFLILEPRSLALWMLISFALGGVVGMLVSSAIMVRLRASLALSKRQLQRTQSELDGIREGSASKEAV